MIMKHLLKFSLGSVFTLILLFLFKDTIPLDKNYYVAMWITASFTLTFSTGWCCGSSWSLAKRD